MTLYKIKDWATAYETHETRRLVALKWVPVPNKHDGLTFRRMAAEPDAAQLFGAWNLILQVASKTDKDHRGELIRGGVPISAHDLALMTGFPEAVFARALAYFSQPSIGWLDTEQSNYELPLSPALAVSSPGFAGERPENPPPNGRKEGTNEGMERLPILALTGQAPDQTDHKAAFEQIWAAYPRKVSKKKTAAVILSLLRHNPPAFGAELLVKVKAYAAAVARWQPGQEHFVPHPATWFGQGRYDDDPATWERRGTTGAAPRPDRINFKTDDYSNLST